MACRYPGGVVTPEDLWELVAAEHCVVSELPKDRGWDLDSLLNAGAISTRHGAFLDDGADFDPEFFGVSPREAAAIHPAQRLIMMTAWECIERAGIAASSLQNKDVGVFVGITGPDYGPRWHEAPQDIRGRVLTGTSPSMVSGRVSYLLGLTGPSVSVDTACSSSLVSVHLACESLRSGDSELALAGGATFHGTPGIFTEFSRQGAMSPDGKCKSFADTADGTGWSEGGGMLLLARLSDATRRGYPVLAVIRGTGVNQDGPSTRLTAPNPAAQERLIRQTLVKAGLVEADVDALEAHGTGTRLGDPIEANSIIATYGQRRSETHPIWLGSLKSNIGHTVAGAGVGGIIKMVMAMRHSVLPRTLHVETPNPLIEWSAGNVRLLTEQIPWPARERPRRAAVSSFGASGTNAHAILEEPPAAAPSSGNGAGVRTSAEPLPWVLSARTGEALRGQARRLIAHLHRHPELDVVPAARGLWQGRSRFDHRAIVTGHDRGDLLTGLEAIADGEFADQVLIGAAQPAKTVTFVFPGQGAQWAGMAAELASASPAFAARLTECAEALAPHCDWSLLDVLRQAPQAPSLDRVDVVQPALFAVMVALAGLWRSYGVEPSAAIGHSQGEIAAAQIAGALSLADAAKIVALRSRALAALSGADHGMASAALTPDETLRFLSAHASELTIAAVNGPRSTVFAGPRTALLAVVAAMEAAGHRARLLTVDYASHSPQVEAIREELLGSLAGITPHESSIPFYSTVSGERIDTSTLDAEYWYRNLRQPVRFDDAVRAMLADGHTTFIEASPHPVLLNALEDIADEASASEVVALASLRRDDGTAGRFARSLAEAHVRGVELDPDALFAGFTPQRVDLPTYAFQNRLFWLDEAAGATSAASSGLASTGHALLGSSIALPDSGGFLLTGTVSLRTFPWLAEHAVQQRAVLPGAAIAEMVIRAADEAGCPSVAELTLHHPVVLPEEGVLQLQVAVGGPADDGQRTVSVFSRKGNDPVRDRWTRHAHGLLATVAPSSRTIAEPLEWPPAAAKRLAPAELYARFDGTDIGYGPAFRAVSAAWQDGEEFYVEVALPPDRENEKNLFGLHPVLFDSALHVLPMSLLGADDRAVAHLPFGWTGVSLHASGCTSLRVRVVPDGAGSFAITATDTDGRPVLTVESLEVLPLATGALNRAEGRLESRYVPVWRPVAASGRPAAAETWTVLGPTEFDLGPCNVPFAEHPELKALCDALAAGAPAPDVVLLPVHPAGDPAQAVVSHVLAVLKTWLAHERLTDTRLVVLTRGAVAASEGESADPAAAAVWGLMRSAQSEHPDRFVLIDVDEDPLSMAALPGSLAAGEPQLALRSGVATAFRLARHTGAPASHSRTLDPEGTVLITGGTGTLGGLLARHLVTTHGVSSLLLASRRGADAPGAADLAAELTALGAKVTLARCDTGDRDSVARLLDTVPPQHPLTAVVHAAGGLADGLIESLTDEDVARVMEPKALGALHLDELTRDHDLSAFVLFSSCAATFGSPGQGNYAAANAFLDGLAHHRRARGLPATALGWGLWDERSEMTAHIGEKTLVQLVPGAFVAPLSSEEGLALFDACWLADDTMSVPVRLSFADPATGAEERLTPLLRDLAPKKARRVVSDSSTAQSAKDTARDLAARLSALSPPEQLRTLVDLVRTHAAAVLGQDSPDALAPEQSFRNFGMESLGAVELRNRLSLAIGKRLTAAVIFDHSTPAKLGAHIHRLVMRTEPQAPTETPASPPQTIVAESEIDSMDLDALVNLVTGNGGSSSDIEDTGRAVR